MKETLIIAGFGGQGVLSMGKILAYSGVMQNYEVTWMPSYGPEMRGGTANVTVILSDRRISSPIANDYDFFNHLTIFLQNNFRHIFIGSTKLNGFISDVGNC